MIHKPNFFKKAFVVFVLGLTFACGTTKEALTYTKVYESTAAGGKHARALIYADPFIIAGGADGYFSVHNLDTNALPTPIVEQVLNMEDFRDATFQSTGACLFMNAGNNGVVYAVVRSGQRIAVYDTAGVFFDGMDFWDEKNGILFGDPIGDHFFLSRTGDYGQTWQALTPAKLPLAMEGEAGFAASGTGIQTIGDSAVYFVTGAGPKARLFCSYDRGENWVVKETPMKSGGSFGIYSTFFLNDQEGFIIGGSYQDSTYKKGICQYTTDGGDSWVNRSKGLAGYCSCIQGTPDGKLIVATGRMGTYYSADKGNTWNLLTNTPFYTCNVTANKIVLLGRNGHLTVFEFKLLNE